MTDRHQHGEHGTTDNLPISRRTLLRTGITLPSAAIGGCLARDGGADRPTVSRSRSLTRWTHQQCTPDRVGHGDLSDAALPTGTGQQTALAGQRIAPAPAAADGVVFAADTGGRLAALDLRGDGIERRWQVEFGAAVSRGVVVDAGTVFVATTDGHVYAVDAHTGTTAWTFLPPALRERDDERLTPQTPTVHDGTVVVAYRGGGPPESRTVFGLDAADGTVRWDAESPGTPSTPTVTAAVLTGDAAFTLEGDRRWTNPLFDQHPTATVTGVAVADGAAYVASQYSGDGVSGFVQALSVEEGEELWRRRLSETPKSLLSATDEYVLLGGAAFRAASGEPHWSVFGPSHACPAIAEGVAHLADEQGRVLAVDLETGEERWSVDVGAEPLGGVLLHEGRLVLGTADGLRVVS